MNPDLRRPALHEPGIKAQPIRDVRLTADVLRQTEKIERTERCGTIENKISTIHAACFPDGTVSSGYKTGHHRAE